MQQFCALIRIIFEFVVMIRIKLREAMESYRLRTGQRITYAALADMSGVGEGTLSSIGSRIGYNVTLDTIEKISRALDMPFQDLLEQIPDPPTSKSRRKPKRTPKKSSI